LSRAEQFNVNDRRNGWTHEELACQPVSVVYDFDTRNGKLVMAEGNSCDMAGCIALFSRIDPEVESIETIAGNKTDTCYQRKGQKWRARP
jgi:hypothetical protein